MAYEDCRCNDSKCQGTPAHWICTRCGAMNCKHARVSCAGCGEWRVKCEQSDKGMPLAFWTGTNAINPENS